MKAITIRQLRDETGRWIRQAMALGEIQVTTRGKIVAKLISVSPPLVVPFFSRRKLLPAFRSVRLTGGKDATRGISAERDGR